MTIPVCVHCYATVPNIDTDDSLDVNLDNLLIQLRPQVTTKWFHFGQAAGIDKEMLESFAKQCSLEDSIMEMLDYWLRHCKEVPTWRDIAEILKKISLPKLAHDIEGVYRTGKTITGTTSYMCIIYS